MVNQSTYPWINPIGGVGDMLMLSGILKQVNNLNPEKKYNFVKRTNYLNVFKGHPAINEIGFPGKNAEIKNVDYWSMDKLGPGNKRAYQVLAKSFGLDIPAKEILYIPDIEKQDQILEEFIPWKNMNILIAPASDSPRKIMPAPIWHALVDMLKIEGYFVLQVGRQRDLHIRNAYSILGLTDIRQALNIIKQCDVVITSDNFIMHASFMLGKKTIVLWGATLKEAYGYEGHFHIVAPRTCKLPVDEECIDIRKSTNGSLYGTKCPENENHCMGRLNPMEILKLVNKII